MSSTPTASIVILTFNNLDLTRQCLESIFAKTSAPDFEVIIVDNASTDGTQQYIQALAGEHENVRLVLNQENTGFARGNNQGAAQAGGEYLVFLNNDTVVTRGWLEGLLKHLHDPVVGMAGPVTNSAGNESRIRVDYQDLDGMDAFAEQYTQAHAGDKFEIEMLAFMCVGLRSKVWAEIGPLDERFGRGMFEDDDYALRLKQAGYKILCIEDVFIHHWGSASFNKLGHTQYRHLFEENRAKFEEKWGLKWQPHMYRRELAREQLREMVDTAAWREEEISWRDVTINRQNETIKTQNQELAALQARTGELAWKLQVAERSLKDLHESTSWRLMERIRRLLLPPGSKWEQVVHRFSHRVQGLETGSMVSWAAYAFYRYRRSRQMAYKTHLEGVRCPSISGLVSVVLPVYNGADYVGQAIDSILAQSYPMLELIAVDDGSTDETPKILDEYARQDARVQVIHQANARLPGALNAGFRSAHGEYLTWTSADNRLKREYLAEMIACLKRHPGWDWVYANIDIIGEQGEPLKRSVWYGSYQDPPGSEHISLPADPSELNVVANNYVGAAFMYRDRLDMLLGEYSRERFGLEDYDYCMRANALLTLQHVDFKERYYEYRFHGTSLTSRDGELGITRSREGLMTFEDARRDFYNTPLGWLISDNGDEQAKILAGEIRAWAKAAGHVLIGELSLDLKVTPRLWFPFAALHVTCDPAEAVHAPQGPERAYQVLVVAGNGALPVTAESGWDLCLAAGKRDGLVRLEKTRQGWLGIADVAELCTVVDIRTKGQHLAELEVEIARPVKPSLKVTVVISTYQRGAQLRDAVSSLARQSLAAQDYEVIVVNNDPGDKLVGEVLAGLWETDFAEHPEQLRLVVCPFKGLSFGRNAGISEARGEVICFLDDDAAAFPDWLEQVWRAFQEHPKAGVVGGPIILKPPEPKPRWLKPGWGHYWSEFLPSCNDSIEVDHWWEYPWGANWSATRQALLAIGGFRSAYGRRGSDFRGGEEVMAALLIHRLGYSVVVTPHARVDHMPDASRYTFQHVSKTIYSGKMTEYNQQADLYFPMNLTRWDLARERSEYWSKAIYNLRAPFYTRLESFIYFRAVGKMMKRLREAVRDRQKIFLENELSRR